MYRSISNIRKSQISSQGLVELGERIETKILRMIDSNEPIDDTAPLIYTERKDGVLPAYDIRTDKWDIAVDAMDHVTKDALAKRGSQPEKKDAQGDSTEKESGANDSSSGDTSQ